MKLDKVGYWDNGILSDFEKSLDIQNNQKTIKKYGKTNFAFLII